MRHWQERGKETQQEFESEEVRKIMKSNQEKKGTDQYFQDRKADWQNAEYF